MLPVFDAGALAHGRALGRDPRVPKNTFKLQATCPDRVQRPESIPADIVETLLAILSRSCPGALGAPRPLADKWSLV
eukprot:11165191-Lingulodinium_polyedra.AAC.1